MIDEGHCGRFVAEVCVVADWGSIPLDSFPFADRLAIAEEIDTRWQDLLQPMQSQRADCWGIETMMLLRETLIKYHRKP